VLFKIAAAAFWYLQTLEMRYHAKFRQNRWNSCGDMVLKMAAVAILDFQNSHVLMAGTFCTSLPHFVKIGQTVAEISQIL